MSSYIVSLEFYQDNEDYDRIRINDCFKYIFYKDTDVLNCL